MYPIAKAVVVRAMIGCWFQSEVVISWLPRERNGATCFCCALGQGALLPDTYDISQWGGGAVWMSVSRNVLCALKTSLRPRDLKDHMWQVPEAAHDRASRTVVVEPRTPRPFEAEM